MMKRRVLAWLGIPVLIFALVGCQAIVKQDQLSLEAKKPGVISYEFAIGPVKSTVSIDVPFSEQIVGWVSGAIGEAKNLLGFVDPGADDADDG